ERGRGPVRIELVDGSEAADTVLVRAATRRRAVETAGRVGDQPALREGALRALEVVDVRLRPGGPAGRRRRQLEHDSAADHVVEVGDARARAAEIRRPVDSARGVDEELALRLAAVQARTEPVQRRLRPPRLA